MADDSSVEKRPEEWLREQPEGFLAQSMRKRVLPGSRRREQAGPEQEGQVIDYFAKLFDWQKVREDMKKKENGDESDLDEVAKRRVDRNVGMVLEGVLQKGGVFVGDLEKLAKIEVVRNIEETVAEGGAGGLAEALKIDANQLLEVNKEKEKEGFFEDLAERARKTGFKDQLGVGEVEELIKRRQKESLKVWLEYLATEAVYPSWYKKWVFESLPYLGSTETTDTGEYRIKKRTPRTTVGWPELDQAALALVFDGVKDLTAGRDDPQVKRKKIDFRELYAAKVTEVRRERREIIDKDQQPEWRVVEKFDESESEEGKKKKTERLMKLSKGTPWCVVGESVAEGYLGRSSFHILVFKDEGEEDVAVAGIEVGEHNDIVAIHGVEKGQELAGEWYEQVAKRIEEMGMGSAQEYFEKVRKMKALTKMYGKLKKEEQLSDDEVLLVYGVEGEIRGFGSTPDPRLEEVWQMIRDQRGAHWRMIGDKLDSLEQVDWNGVVGRLRKSADESVDVEAIRPILDKMVLDGDYRMKLLAGELIEESGQVGEFKDLLAALAQDDDYRVRLRVAVAIGKSGQVGEFKDLLTVLAKDSDDEVRWDVAVAIGNSGQVGEFKDLLTVLAKDSDGGAKREAENHLRLLGESG